MLEIKYPTKSRYWLIIDRVNDESLFSKNLVQSLGRVTASSNESFVSPSTCFHLIQSLTILSRDFTD